MECFSENGGTKSLRGSNAENYAYGYDLFDDVERDSFWFDVYTLGLSLQKIKK